VFGSVSMQTPVLSNSVIKLTGAKSACTAPKSVCTGAKSLSPGAKSVCTDLKPLGTAPVSVLPPIVPAPAAESRAAGWLNQRWDGIRTGYAYDRFDRTSEFSTGVSERLHGLLTPFARRFGPPTRATQLRQSLASHRPKQRSACGNQPRESQPGGYPALGNQPPLCTASSGALTILQVQEWLTPQWLAADCGC
jgi:hypothetical protein